MIDLDKYNSEIESFILNSIRRFVAENGHPSSIGLYCCPWAGWLSTHFNKVKTLEETRNNCPDFEYVEFDLLDFPEWQEEYEKELPEYKIGGKIVSHDHDLGSDALNYIFFQFLQSIATKIKQQRKEALLLQMLDSRHVSVL